MNFLNCPWCSKPTVSFAGRGITGFGPHRCSYCNNQIAFSLNLFRDKLNLVFALVGSVVLWPFIGFAGCLISLAFLIVASIRYEKWLGK